MSRCDPEFEPLLLPHFLRDQLDRHAGTVFGLWRDTRLAYMNEAWFKFAAANGGQPTIGRHWGLGAQYFNCIPPILRRFYEDLLACAREPGKSSLPVSHEYECSSAAVVRVFRMHVYTLPHRAGYIVVNSLVVERPHNPVERPPGVADPATYTSSEGVIRQCSHCRRVERVTGSEGWDWVPRWVEHSPPGVTHAVCPICFEYYYPEV